jgi:2-oxoglutarate dehydrogenase E1 component
MQMTQPEPEISDLNLEFIENLYADFLSNPESVPAEWREYFKRFGGKNGFRSGRSREPESIFHCAPAALNVLPDSAGNERVEQLIRAYRVRGHMLAKVDPLGLRAHPQLPELELSHHHFSEDDLDHLFVAESLPGANPRTLRSIVNQLQQTYCHSIGVQFMHIDDLFVRQWLLERMEASFNRSDLSRTEQLDIFTRLTDAAIFEEFIHKKFTGAKSFSLEGSETLIPLLALAIERAAEQGVENICMGMAHRGRLNVLANILHKSPQQIFREFEDKERDPFYGPGDVKYHLGHSADWSTASGRRVHLSLSFNPSHLEFVDPVVLGRTRARQDVTGDSERTRTMALLIHGDAAFAGEGIVQETLNLSELEGYSVGGTLHVIINNQIGFTTDPAEARSSTYATDICKMLQTPIFHVNGEDPEAVAHVVRLAMDFRKMFQRDVFIDMYCYRRRGHNEADEPAFTQPLVYQAIEQRSSVRDGYLQHLLKLGEITAAEADEIAVRRREELDRELSSARVVQPPLRGEGKGSEGGRPSQLSTTPAEKVEKRSLTELLEVQTQMPPDFHLHPKIERGLERRRKMARGELPLDWSAAEALAFARLAAEGHRIRLSGQDSARGTFSQRHAVLHDIRDGHRYVPLEHVAPGQATVEMINSPLSELGVLGFEYGYSLNAPNGLTLWEAQFGDFWNAAQVIVDQFIASAEEKWKQLSGLVLLLPHGAEGMGPEHTSARIERFLQLATKDNFQLVVPTTPAQYFHVLCRQVLRPLRKPLVIMTPKSLLRAPEVVSPWSEFNEKDFRNIIPDEMVKAEQASRILLCSGKIYYDLLHERRRLERNDAAIIRIEQLYPLREESLNEVLAPFANSTPLIWVQEEPENMGAWRYMKECVGERIGKRFHFSGIYRPAAASPASGSASTHTFEQQKILNQAFEGASYVH